MFTDPLQEFVSSDVALNNLTSAPELTDLSIQRREALANRPRYKTNRLPYITYEEISSSGNFYDPLDFNTVSQRIRDNVIKAVISRFPLQSDTYTVKLENPHYEAQKKTRLKDEREAILQQKTIADRLRGDLVLYDNATGKELQRKALTLVNVPRMTERGTFIRNGSFIGMKHMFRLRPGVYARIKDNGIVQAHINPQQGTGRQMAMELDPENGVLNLRRAGRQYGVLPLLIASGVPEEEIRKAWGDELYEMNREKYKTVMAPGNKKMQDYRDLWENDIKPIMLDPETTQWTLGTPYEQIQPSTLLQASNKILRIARNAGNPDAPDETDDRDGLQYQRVLGPADYIAERIIRDGGGLLRNTLNQITRDGNLDKVGPGLFQPQVDSVFLEDKHAGYLEESSPLEAVYFNSGVSRLGEGGIGDTRAAPAESRGVQNSYVGFVDIIQSPECYDRDTEILTSSGWLTIDKLTKNMEVACMINDKISFHKPVYVNRMRYEGPMYGHRSDVIDYLVTPNHRIWHRDMVNKEYRFSRADDVHESHYIYVNISEQGQEEAYELLMSDRYVTMYNGFVYCPTVPGGKVYVRRHGSHGFWCGNSLKVGLDNYLTHGVRKDDKGNLYTPMRMPNGEVRYVDMATAATSTYTTPEYFDPKGNPDERIPAFVKGKSVEWVPRKDVDMYVANTNNMMSRSLGTVPMIGGIRSNRALLGCLHPDTKLLVKINGECVQKAADELLEIYDHAESIQLVTGYSNCREPLWAVVQGVYKRDLSSGLYIVKTHGGKEAVVSGSHKWNVALPYAGSVQTLITTDDSRMIGSSVRYQWAWDIIKSVTPVPESEWPEYLVDIDMNDSEYMLANGLFTHNSKYGVQAVSVPQREAPLVRRSLVGDNGEDTTTEAYLGRALGARFSPVDGTVVSVDSDEIKIKGTDGKIHEVDLYNNYPLNQKGFLQNTSIVAPGDKVKANQILAPSNYTDKEGNAALGVNLRMAFMSAKNAGTFEDAILVSESAARTKLASEQLYKIRGEINPDVEYSKDKFIRNFGSNGFTREQLDKLGDDGMAKEGVELEQGDPVFIGVRKQDQSTRGISRNAVVPYVERWEHNFPGTVKTVAQGRKHLTTYINALTPMQDGDKMCYDDQTEVLTNSGWKLFKDIKQDDRILTLDYSSGKTYFTDFISLYSFYHKGRMYSLVTPDLDICVTDNHKHLVARNCDCSYMKFMTSEEVFGRCCYHFTGMDADFVKPRFYKCSQVGRKTKEKWVQYEGFVYCLEVPYTHTLYVRRNKKAVWSGNSNRYGAKGAVKCYTKNYEIFTKSGFKKFEELTEEDEVAAFDPNTGTAHFENPSIVIHKEHDGDVYCYEDRNLDWEVTPEHDMWTRMYPAHRAGQQEEVSYSRVPVTRVHGGRWQHRVAALFEDTRRHIIDRVRLEDKSKVKRGSNCNIVDFDVVDFAAFLGLWLAEGHLAGRINDGSGDYRQVVITQKLDSDDPRSVARCTAIEKAITRLGFTYSRSGLKYVISSRSLCCYLKQFGHSQDKFIPPEVFDNWPEKAQRALVEHMFLGDGDSCYTHVRRYMTSSYRLARDFQRLCLLLGYSSRIRLHKHKPDSRSGKEHCPIWRVSFSSDEFFVSKNMSDGRKAGGYRIEHYKGMVYCCTVSTGIILVQRNGKPMWCGNCVPDEWMPIGEDGERIDVLQSPLGLPSRVNAVQLAEAALGKIAVRTGKPIALPDFMPNEDLMDWTLNKLKEHGIDESETLYDPATGKYIPDVNTGVMFYYKMKHMADLKQGARGTGGYTVEEIPTKGSSTGARRLGGLEVGGLLGGGGDELLREAKLVRGQQNDEFWRAYRNGEVPEAPGMPLVHKKFFNHLRAAGVNLDDRGNRIHIYGATDDDLKKLSENRQVVNSSTFDARQLRPVKGGLFDPSIFGPNGDQWGYFELPEPVLNPLMFKPVANMLGWKDKELEELLKGERRVNDKVGIEALQEVLHGFDIKKELRTAKEILRDPRAPISKQDKALKKVRAIEPMLREGKKPEDMLWTRLPVLPPVYRQVNTLSDDVNIVADSNFLYKRVMDAAEDLQEAKQVLPKEALMDARTSLYNAVDELVGLKEPADVKLQAKNVGGLLKWAFGKGSPKLSALHRKVFGATVDFGARGVVIPDNSLSIDQIGLPEKDAWKMYEAQVVRRLRQRGFSMLDAVRNVVEQTPEARKVLEQVMEKMPIIMNRAPSLWEYSLRGFYPVLTKGSAIHVSPDVVNPYNMDFDGDSVKNLVRIAIQFKMPNRNYEKTEINVLKNLPEALYWEVETNQLKGATDMFSHDTNVFTAHTVMPLEELPTVAGSEIKKSETVTEWDVVPGYFVDTLNPAEGTQVIAPITKVSRHRNTSMYHVTCAVSGSYTRIINASEDHSLITYNAYTGLFEKTKPIDAVGRLIPRITPAGGNSADHCIRYIDLGVKTPLSYDLGVVLGAIIADGWVDSNSVVRIAANDDSIRETLLSLTQQGKTLPVTKDSAEFSYDPIDCFGAQKKRRITVYMTQANAKKLKDHIGSGAQNKKLPWPSLGASRAHMIGLFVGLLSTDGSISYSHTAGKKAAQKGVTYNTSSPYLRDGIQELAVRLGVRSSVHVYRGANSTSDCYMITFSVGDIVRLYNAESRFRLIHQASQERLEQIVFDTVNASQPDTLDIVPYPYALFCELTYAGAAKLFSKPSVLSGYRTKGYMSREHALKIAELLQGVDWDNYTEPSALPKSARTGHSPVEARAFVNAWCAFVRTDRIKWTRVVSAEPYGVEDAWDITVPGPYTFALADGTVVQDTAALHVPTTKQAIDAVNKKMLPSRSLLSPQFGQVHYYPVAEFLQGLHLATRKGKNAPVRFKSEEEMLAALNRGDITYDTEYIIG